MEACQNFNQRNIAIFGFANNHYAGHAPATVRLFWDLWRKKKRSRGKRSLGLRLFWRCQSRAQTNADLDGGVKARRNVTVYFRRW